MDRVFFVITSGSPCVEPCMGLRSRVFTAHFWTLATGWLLRVSSAAGHGCQLNAHGNPQFRVKRALVQVAP